MSVPIPGIVADDEPLHRRIHPTFLKPDGTVSSQAFTDPDLSVDRGRYRTAEESLENYPGFGLAALLAVTARMNDQDVFADPDLLNPAHAIAQGAKPKSVARALARASTWVISL